MTPEGHNKLLAWGHIAWGSLFALMGIMFGLMFGLFGVFAAADPHQKDPFAGAFFGFFGVIFGVMYLVFSVPSIIAGIGLLKERRWAKIWAIIGAVLSAMSFPIGTAVCVYTFWFLFSDPGKILYEGAAPNAQRDPAPLYSAPADAYWSGSEAKTREYQYTPPTEPPNWRD
jgi:hypothetical protein